MSEALNPTPLVSVVEDVAQVGRKVRRPLHNFWVKHPAFAWQPFMIAPVLPGDSLSELDLKVTGVTSPLVSSLLGWWIEHAFFYVKLTDLWMLTDPQTPGVYDYNDADEFRKLMLSSTADLSNASFTQVGYTSDYGSGAGGYGFANAAIDVVGRAYFRDSDETNLPMCGTTGFTHLFQARAKPPGQESWTESLQLDGTEDIPDVVLGDPAVRDPEDPYYEMWLRMQQMSLTELTYDDWLRDQGVSVPKAASGGMAHPEVIRWSRTFKKPSVTPDSSGAVGSVCFWDVAEKATKKKVFKEPGFIIGFTCARSKVYLSKQLGSAMNYLMDTPFAWMPKALSERPELALRKFADDATGPFGTLPNPTAGYWADTVDLFVYGDQFLNFDVSTTPAGTVALPGPLMSKTDSLYPSTADIEKLFTSAAASGAITGRVIEQEGVVRPSILSRLRDLT